MDSKENKNNPDDISDDLKLHPWSYLFNNNVIYIKTNN